MLESLGSDLRFGARTLWKSRAFSAIAIITLALGVGASSAIFSVIDNILLEPFPYPAAQRLMSLVIHDTDQSNPGGRGAFTGAEFLDYSTQNHVFENAIGMAQTDVFYASGEGTERFVGMLISPNTFEFLGVQPLLGRAAQIADYQPGAPPTFVLRYKTWVSRFQLRSFDPEQNFHVERGVTHSCGNHAASFCLGRRRHVDSPDSDPG